jgi:serine/threonine-protein kinase
MVLEQDPPPPRLVNSKADPDLEMIALKALQKPADLRYASANALADDLEAFLCGDSIAARSSHFSQVLSRAFRPTHHVGVMQNWGLLWMWHSLVLLVLCLLTNWMHWRGIASRSPYLALWGIGLGTWAAIFWNLRRRSGPVTFVERQIAHVWAGSMICSTLLYAVEWLLDLPVLTLSPVLALLAGAVFIVKAGILSGEFYVHAAAMFVTCVPMAIYPSWGLAIFGVVSALTFLIPGWKFHRLRLRDSR